MGTELHQVFTDMPYDEYEERLTGRWISVSERLPETNGRYLAYIINEHDDKLKYIMTCEYVVGSYCHWFPDDECASDNVIAWMPLPKSYEPQERRKNDNTRCN